MSASHAPRKNPLQGEGLVPGLRLQLELNVGNRSETYSSCVEEIGGDSLGILVPMVRLKRRPLPVGAVVRASYMFNNRQRRFVTEVVGHSRDGLVDYLRMPARVEDADRRRFFRLETSLQPRELFRLVVDSAENGAETPVAIDGTVIDISEGGLCFTTRAHVTDGERLGVQLELPQAGALNARLKVTSVELPRDRQLNRRIHCKFTHLTRRDQDLIARFLMKRQLELRRRGAL
jgi:c-di-GMP-binding flagellar brake protein YcgR